MLIRRKKFLARAIAISLSSLGISVGITTDASAQTMYNTHFPVGGTDGRLNSPWVGTVGGALPFSYNGNQALN